MTYTVPAGQAYYVTARNPMGTKTVCLSGPYATHGAAARDVDAVRGLVRVRYPHDTDAQWATFGVSLVNDNGRPMRCAFTPADLLAS